MKLGIAMPWANPQVRVPVERVLRAEALGYDTVWSAEIYGQDAITPLAYLAAHTRRIRLGTAVIQAAARTPAATAMAMATVDQLAGGGRVIIGIGLSGPQIVEGWYGQPWGSPNARLRDYVSIIKKVLAREEPVVHEGQEIRIPYQTLSFRKGADTWGLNMVRRIRRRTEEDRWADLSRERMLIDMSRAGVLTGVSAGKGSPYVTVTGYRRRSGIFVTNLPCLKLNTLPHSSSR